MADDLKTALCRIRESPHSYVQEALRFIKQTALEYGVESLAFSFNGGKDSTALLYLLAAALPQTSERNSFQEIFTVYFHRQGGEMPQCEQFLRRTAERFGLDLLEIDSTSFKDGLKQMLAVRRVQAIFMGQRRIDPHASTLTLKCPTSPGWPQLMRLNPILEWSHGQVWEFLRSTALGYCSLYDMGYTSLGSPEDTQPNPHLRREDGKGFFPAYTLRTDHLERAGRCTATRRQDDPSRAVDSVPIDTSGPELDSPSGCMDTAPP